MGSLLDHFVLNDPKAFLFDKSKNLLVIQVSLAIVDNSTIDQYFQSKASAYDQTVWQGSYDYYNTKNQWIMRALYIGNTLYTISNGEVKLNNLTDMTQIAQVTLK